KRRGVRHGQAVHRDQLGHPQVARRRRAAERAGARAGARHERARPVPHDPRADPKCEPRGAAVSRRHRDPANPAGAARVVPQERAIVRPGRPARVPRPDRLAARQPEVRGRRRHVPDGPERLSGASEGVRGDGRRAREHALCWALKRDAPEATVFAAPGNPGTAQLGTNLRIAAVEVVKVVEAVQEHHIDLAIVGPEAPLAAGLADRLRAAGRPVFGPTQAAARIESSKAFAKDVMQRAGVPTPASRTFDTLDPALAYIRGHAEPLVVKASGLAGGKGAVVCATRDAAARTARAMLADGALGDAGREIVVEQFLEGEELSVLALTDGERILVLPAAQDHKRLGEGDAGPNTGGMGAYCPD